jgi:Aconitase A
LNRGMDQLRVGDESYGYYKLDERAARLPYTLRILLENVLRNGGDADAVADWVADAEPSQEIAFNPARVLLQDFTGVPAVVDLAAMRNAMRDQGGEPDAINPQIPVELVIDHSVQVDEFASRLAIERNVELEFERNHERYASSAGARAPSTTSASCRRTPASSIRSTSSTSRASSRCGTGRLPDTLVGTDSHTTMVNGLGVLGWGVGGIEAEARCSGRRSRCSCRRSSASG